MSDATNEIKPLEFQDLAAAKIVTRFMRYQAKPFTYDGPQGVKVVAPFYQDLAAMTGAGKTVILASVVKSIHERLSPLQLHPVILWLSQARVVVDQAYDNLQAGGKYHHLLGACDIKTLKEYRPRDVSEAEKAMLFFATVGTFNQKAKDESKLLVFQSNIDDLGGKHLWQALGERLDSQGQRRPLVVVYDEGHNLTDQQMDLLLDLDPDALLFASATMKRPAKLQADLDLLHLTKGWHDWQDKEDDDAAAQCFTTRVPSEEVVGEGLIKTTISIGAYQSHMELTLDQMLAQMREVEDVASREQAGWQPKAIYVANTNVLEGGVTQEDEKLPFEERQARPITIWRYLVAKHGVAPAEIAVLGDLKFDKAFPPPAGFRHFKGGPNDYDAFIRGNFRHIIFNKALLEGWDDPEVYFAYIDKSMGSTTNIKQVIGRVLRQPGAGAVRYQDPLLNTAQFYIRLDNKAGSIEQVIRDVQRELDTTAPGVKAENKSKGAKPDLTTYPAREERIVPVFTLDMQAALAKIREILERFPDYRSGGSVTQAVGQQTQIQIKTGSGEESAWQWVDCPSNFPVSVLWRLREYIRVEEQFPRVVQALPAEIFTDEKFNARIELGSAADQHVIQTAQEIVRIYTQKIELKPRNPARTKYVVPAAMVDEKRKVRYENALHDAYSTNPPLERGLSSSEQLFAEELNRTGHTWCRNPDGKYGGWGIPLLTKGESQTFYPDFLVWVDEHSIIAVDPTGSPYMEGKLANKLLYLGRYNEDTPQIVLLLVSDGEWEDINGKATRVRNNGHTVFHRRLVDGEIVLDHYATLADAVRACIALGSARRDSDDHEGNDTKAGAVDRRRPGGDDPGARDIVLTIPKDKWRAWLDEGACAGDEPQAGEAKRTWHMLTRQKPRKDAIPGVSRVYIWAAGRLRGYSILKRILTPEEVTAEGYDWPGAWGYERGPEAFAVTINEDEPTIGFQGARYRWWGREEEHPFPDWKTAEF